MGVQAMADWADFVNSKRSDSLPPLTSERLENGVLISAYFEYYGIDFENRYEGLEHFFGGFDSAGYQIAAHVFRLPQAQGTVFIYHGFYDHVGLYNHLINFCLTRGYSVVAYDLPGHGLSSGERASIDSFDTYGQVLRDAFAAVAEFELPQKRIALAQSTGCAVLMTHLLSGGGEDFDKVALLAPLVRPAGWWWGRPVHKLIGHRIDSLPRKWQQNSEDMSFLEWLKTEDRLQHDRLPMSWIAALKDWEPRFHRLPQSDRDLLVIQGQKDGTVAWRFNISAIRDRFPRARIHYLDTARHHLVKESETIRHRIWLLLTQYLSE